MIEDVVLCVEEAATNAIRHSGSDRDVEISLRFAGGDLLAEVKDHGRGFDLASFDREALPDVLSDHGRGLFIVARLMDSLELGLDGGLAVRMTRRAEPRCAPQSLESGLGESVADGIASDRARTRALLEEIDEAFVALDWEYRYVHANQAALHMMGKSLDELYGHTPWEVLPQLRDGLFEQRHRDAMELGRPSVFEQRSVVSDDWLEVRIYPTSAGISIYLREINARKRQETEREELLSALRDSEERYRGLFQSESDALLLIDQKSGRVLEANPAAAAMYGYTTEELLDLTDLDISAEPELTQSAAQSAAVGETVAVPSRMHRRKDGTTFAVEMTGRVFSLQGRMVRVAAVRDVTARKQAEEVLGRFELLAANSRDIILFMDRDGQIIEANAAAERAYGYTRDELLKLTIADLRAAQTKAEMAAQMTEADWQGILFESLHRRSDGSLFAVEVSSRGATIGGRRTLVSVVRDISERKRAEDELRDSDARFRLALRNAPASVAVHDRELRYVWALRETVRLGEALASIDALVHSSLDFTTIMQSALRAGAEAIGAETAGTSMHDDEARQFRVAYIHNYPPDKLGILIPDADDTHGVEAMRTGRTLAISDTQNDPRVVAELMDAWNVKSVICAPLVVRGRPIAVAYFNYHTAAHCFSEQEIEFVTKLAASLSGALENAQLFESERQACEQAARDLATTQSLLAAVRALSGMWTDSDALLGELADVVVRATSHARVCVAQLSDDRSQATFVTTVGKDPLPARTVLAWDQLSSVLQDVLISGRRGIVDFNELPQAQRGIADSIDSRLALHVPIVFAGRVLGYIAVDDPGERREFTDDEIALIEGIASQAAVAIESARLYKEQRRIAETLQENFLHDLPCVAGLELGVVSQTAFEPELVGGDFSDVFVVDDRHVVVLVGDVAGKGVRAAGITETVRSTVRALAAIDPSPVFILAKANELLLKYDPDEPHVTAFLAVLDPDTGHLNYASAGHPAPIHLGAFSARPLDVAFGPPLGSFERPYVGAHTTVTLDDYLVLYTDGVTEARRDGELFGEQRLLETVAGLRGRSAQELADGVCSAASDFAAGHLSDDLQVVVLRLA